MSGPVLKAGSRPPWVGPAAAVWVEIAAGNAYTFPLYSSLLKSVLGFNQQQVTILGVANDIGENVGLLPGIVCNKFPPWAVLLVGTACCFLGYGVIWLVVNHTLPNFPLWLVGTIHGALESVFIGVEILLFQIKLFQTMLERAIAFLQVPKTSILPSHKEKLAQYEKQIANFIDINKPRSPVSQLQRGQVPSSHIELRDE